MKTERLNLYLQRSDKALYKNTEAEQELLSKFIELFSVAKAARDNCEEANPQNLEKWRKAYLGTLGALTKDGTESKRKGRQLRKMVYELIESKVDNSIPMPKMSPRYKSDLPLVDVTENYLKYEMDKIHTKYNNDRSERSTYVDGTTWYKVVWDSLDNTHERSGSLKIETFTVDQIVPQPGIVDYHQLEYIFEINNISPSKIYDLFGKIVYGSDNNATTVEVITCYYLNDDHIVGRFAWTSGTQQVICNEEDWQIRKLRTCKTCKVVVPAGEQCPKCGSKAFKYKVAEKEILSEDLYEAHNPYLEGETDDVTQSVTNEKIFLTAGSEIPFYRITQLPFVPRPSISSMNTIYGVSEVQIILDMQDMINKLYTKAVDKTLKSGAVVTKPQGMKISDTDDTFKLFGVKSYEEAQMVQTKQIVADTSQDMLLASVMYESARSSSGITESYQGKRDTTATSGKARQYAAAQTAGRIESLRVMKAAAFAGLYELMLKYLLAFSDETRKFVKVLPDGKTRELCWNKYMFLAKDKYGDIYYRDDFSFSSDPAATLSQDRVTMWQETLDKFIQGAFGVPNESRTLTLFWNIMEQLQYPLAKVVLAGIKDNSQHLPEAVEQAIIANPQLYQSIIQLIQSQGEQRGGARANSGPQGNGATHRANVERTNTRNRAENRDVVLSAQQISEGGNV